MLTAAKLKHLYMTGCCFTAPTYLVPHATHCDWIEEGRLPLLLHPKLMLAVYAYIRLDAFLTALFEPLANVLISYYSLVS